ncbi:hypothetical protein AAKU61_004291 [Undibacterium sp. GrIS 1.2]|uniref:PIN-like domain-containing protein n=1 Tax=Undibacterium sp. GrIS 1.2 TaxID=3143933 RepID=UPI0033920A66
MPFGTNSICKTKEEHLRSIADLVVNRETLIFFDTNIIAYLYKFHVAARDEFFNWTDAVMAGNRLRIPAWSANEYLSRLTSNQLQTYTPKSKEPDQIKKTLETMLEAASLFVDDSLLRKISFLGDRTLFLAEFRKAIDAIPQFTCAFKQQFDPKTVHEQIMEHLSPAVLNSDVTNLCVRAAKEGDTRIEHRLPPGFKDGKKDENRFGDLIIWFEILEYAKLNAIDFPSVVFISNDEKSDWVYAPQFRDENTRGGRRQIPNVKPEIKLIDPRLVSEFKRTVNHNKIVICNLFDLIEALSIGNPADFRQLAAAIQINIADAALSESSDLSTDELGAENSPAENPILIRASIVEDPDVLIAIGEVETPIVVDAENVNPQQVPALHLLYGQSALHDSEYDSDAPSAINEIIRELKSHNWYIQNPAITKINAIDDQAISRDSWFVLGRNIYQAACGNSGKAMDFVANLGAHLSRLSPENANDILAGMVFEIYFDLNGQFRSEPKAYLIEIPLQQIVSENFSCAKEFILLQLQPYLNELKFLPGTSQKLNLKVVSRSPSLGGFTRLRREHVMQSVQLDSIELICQRDDAAGMHMIRDRCSVTTLIDYISKNLAIPRWAIECTFEPIVEADTTFQLEGDKMIDFRLTKIA